MSKVEGSNLDYYDILGVTYNSTESEIKKAYRKKSLKVHPDKNLDDPSAARLFHELTQALDVLTDPQAKLAYDNVLKARLERKKKYDAQDIKRKAMLDDLKQRENAHKKQKQAEDEAVVKLQTVERLKEDGLKKRQKKEEEIKKQMAGEIAVESGEDAVSEQIIDELNCVLRIKWKRKKHTFETEDLKSIFESFGPVEDAVISTKKPGSALVNFKSVVTAHLVMTVKDTSLKLAEFESINWASGSEPAIVKKLNGAIAGQTPSSRPMFATSAFAATSVAQDRLVSVPSFSFNNAPSSIEQETLALMKMRQTEREQLMTKVNKIGDEGEVAL